MLGLWSCHATSQVMQARRQPPHYLHSRAECWGACLYHRQRSWAFPSFHLMWPCSRARCRPEPRLSATPDGHPRATVGELSTDWCFLKRGMAAARHVAHSHARLRHGADTRGCAATRIVPYGHLQAPNPNPARCVRWTGYRCTARWHGADRSQALARATHTATWCCWGTG